MQRNFETNLLEFHMFFRGVRALELSWVFFVCVLSPFFCPLGDVVARYSPGTDTAVAHRHHI